MYSIETLNLFKFDFISLLSKVWNKADKCDKFKLCTSNVIKVCAIILKELNPDTVALALT